jgi:hypothetical protein
MNINDFLMSPIAEVNDIAARAQRIENMYNNREISYSEYAELAEDLLELRHINKEMVNLEAIREMWQVVTVLKNLKFFASLV